MQVSFDPLLLALSINPHHSSYGLLKESRAFSVNVLKKGQLDLAAHYGGPARPDNKLALTEWTTGRLGAPLLLESLAWFECQVVVEHPAGDHVLVLGKVIDGKLLDSSRAHGLSRNRRHGRRLCAVSRRFRRLRGAAAPRFSHVDLPRQRPLSQRSHREQVTAKRKASDTGRIQHQLANEKREQDWLT